MCCAGADTDWGDWVLGDLADVGLRVAELAGRSAGVTRLTVERTDQERARPVTVTLEVDSERDIYAIHHELTSGTQDVHCLPGASDTGWSAEIHGVLLRVGLTQEWSS